MELAEPTPTFLLDTNITPIQNRKMQAASSFTLNPVIGGTDKNKQLTIIKPNNDLFDRLETVRFFRLFTGEGDMENMGPGNIEPRGLKARILP
jgi:hypothetical protein